VLSPTTGVTTLPVCLLRSHASSGELLCAALLRGLLTTVPDQSRHACRVVGEKVAEHSWFPGYSWQILICAKCKAHIGWRFEKLSGKAGAAAASDASYFFGEPRSLCFP
jgi:hypothetical protein